jgi:hypothetical protein
LRDERWSEAIAVGSLAFVENIKTALGIKALHRKGRWHFLNPSWALLGRALQQISPTTVPWA